MQVVTDLAACPAPAGGTAVTIGAYDGVHRGHRAVIQEVRARAEQPGCPTAVVTFDRHPAIRQLLTAGDVAAAAELLGRPHEVRGVVEPGDGRGGTALGFPTANVGVPAEILLPADGIYAGWYLRPDGSSFETAVSLGRRP